MFKLIGKISTALSGEHLLKINSKPAKIHTIPIIGKIYPVANKAPRYAVATSLNVMAGMNWKNILSPNTISIIPKII